MMSLFLGESANAVHEIKGLLEIREGILPMDVVFVSDAPVGNAAMKSFELVAFERRHASTAGDARLFGKFFGHFFTWQRTEMREPAPVMLAGARG